MAYTLLMTILLSVFLIFCLVYQILTIRKQRHIEAVRQEFLHTMIHELKRPISTLKMCVSFMGNERMMQDEESKRRILSSSHNELDNLTSYFSKLRDITLSDAAENAIKYSHEAVTIHIDYQQRTDGLLQISVADNGIGIARADQRYVFDKFYRSETVKDKAIPGIGLGLSYVKLLVEAHGGTITFESTEGEGTTFTILIPQTDGKDQNIACGR